MTVSKPMDETPTAPEADPHGGSIFTPYRRTQAVVLVASVLSFALFWWGGAAIHIPAERGFSASILQQPGWVLDLIGIYVIFAASVFIGSAIGGRFWFFAGLFAGVVGLIAISARGGPMRYVLFEAASGGNSRGVFLRLILEQCLLFAPVALVWFAFCQRYEAAAALLIESPEETEPAATHWIIAILIQTVVTGFIVWLLTATDAKKQVLVSVFLAGFGGAILAEYLNPRHGGARWFWIGPFLVGIVGYALSYTNAGPITGTPLGTFANLARPLPLDYASAGIAGALLGYWIAIERPHVPFTLGALRIRPGATGSQTGKEQP